MANIVIDELIRSKRKSVCLTITNDARLVVRAPLRLSLKEIEKLVLEKKSWIDIKKKQVLERENRAKHFSVEPGGEVPYLGETLRIITTDKVKSIKLEDGVLLFPFHDQNQADLVLSKWYKKQAKDILTRRLAELSRTYGIPYEACRITSARKRWGSCSSRNHIHLTWRLIMATPLAIDYVIVHELCHVVQKNHSSAFWQKVGEIMPDFVEHRNWLKTNAFILDIFD